MKEKIILDIDATFGKVKFLGSRKEVFEGFGRDRKSIGMAWACYSEKQRGMFVVLPSNVTPKVKFEDEIRLVDHYMDFAHSGSGADAVSERMLYAKNLETVR